MWFTRYFEAKTDFFKKGKVNILYGARRVGKTALIKKVLDTFNADIYTGEGDDIEVRKILSSNNKELILNSLGDYDIVFIDEAQRISDIGWGLKILIDNREDMMVIASGSSSFQLSSQLGAPLTGRTYTKMLFPVSVLELRNQLGGMRVLQNLQQYLIFGMYPECLQQSNFNDKKDYLQQLRNSYMMKDIFEYENIKNPNMLFDLLKLIAFQIGHEVSLNELSRKLGIAKQTVARYLDLLEKAFTIFKVGGFSKNLRKELTKSARYYFTDNGIRNAVINNFNLPEFRNDNGMLWKNFMFTERLKKQHYTKIYSNNYFWRTYDQKELDMVEERDGKLFGYEFKLNRKNVKAPKLWVETYPEATFELINKDNFLNFIT